MARTAIKICGISTAETLEAAVKARVEYIGLVFVEKSPRHVSLTTAAELGARAAGRIGRVGLFVDAGDGTIGEAITAAGLDALQLHGRETPEQVARIRARFGLPVWKALSIASAADIAKADGYAGAADLILFDAKTPDGNLPGGIGLRFDWSLLRHWNRQAPWGLAGGLDAGNVGDAIAQTGAPLVDCSSGVETAPGVKSTEKIADFCAAVRSA